MLEQRLFSEGLHVLGTPPSRDGMLQYLQAYFDGRLTPRAVEVVAGGNKRHYIGGRSRSFLHLPSSVLRMVGFASLTDFKDMIQQLHAI